MTISHEIAGVLAKTMRFGGIILALGLLIQADSLCKENPKRLSIGPQVALVHFGLLSSSSISAGFGLRAQYLAAEQLFFDASVTYGKHQQVYDTPGGPSTLNVTSWGTELSLSRIFFGMEQVADISGHAGIGITWFERDGSDISLGALGSYALPAYTESHVHYLFGLRLDRRLFDGVTMNVGSSVKFLTPLSSPQPSYTFTGGVTLDLL